MDAKNLLEPLEALELLKDRKLIDDEEYHSRKATIIDNMTKSTFKKKADKKTLEIKKPESDNKSRRATRRQRNDSIVSAHGNNEEQEVVEGREDQTHNFEMTKFNLKELNLVSWDDKKKHAVALSTSGSINDDDVSMPLLNQDDLAKVRSQLNALNQEQEDNRNRASRFRSRTMRLPKMEESGEDTFVKILVHEYSRNRVEKRDTYAVESFPTDMSDWATVRWIHCEGFNKQMLNNLKIKFGLHPLAIEDVLEIPHRPKFVYYQNNDCLFLIFQVIYFDQYSTLVRRQVSMFLFEDTVLTIQEGKEPLTCWDTVRNSLQRDSKLRANDVEYLVYSLVDAVVDSAFPILTKYGELLEDAEVELIEQPDNTKKVEVVRKINRELLFVRRMLRPMKDVVEKMVNPLEKKWTTKPEYDEQENEGEEEDSTKMFYFTASIRTYIQDIDDNLSRVIDLIDTYKEVCGSLSSVHSNSQEHKLNQTMYALTVVSTFFLPLTFLAGVYGMNFESQPEYSWSYGYGYFWSLVFTVSCITFGVLKYRKMV